MSIVLKKPLQRSKTNWDDVHTDFLNGMSLKEISVKYNHSFLYIKNVVSEKGWLQEKKNIESLLSEKITNKIIDSKLDIIEKRNKQIEALVDLSLEKLTDILNDESTSTKDMLTAIGKVLDISGLKIINQNSNITEKKIFITTEDVKKTDEHIDQVIDAEIIK